MKQITPIPTYESLDSYDDYPKAARDNARIALDWAEKNGWGSCGTAVGKKRANQLVNGEKLSRDTIGRIASFERHRKNSKKQLGDGCGRLMWLAWGGDECIAWAKRKIKEIDRKDENVNTKLVRITPNRYLYHTSNPIFRNKILEVGLITKGRSETWLSDTKIDGEVIFAVNSDDKDDWWDSTYDDDIYRIDTKNLKNQWYNDPNFDEEDKRVITFENIPKNNIKLIYKGDGKSLDEDVNDTNPYIYDNQKLVEMIETVIEPSSFLCTYAASAVKMLEGDSIKIYGFSTSENPDALYFVEENGDDSDEGHHFAVMNDMYIIDPWVYDNFGRSVFNLRDENDEEMIKYLYGNKNNWTDITDRIEDFEDLFPKTYNNLLEFYRDGRSLDEDVNKPIESYIKLLDLAKKYDDYHTFVLKTDSLTSVYDILYRGMEDGDELDHHSFFTDYVGHAKQYGMNVDGILYNNKDVLYFDDKVFNQLRDKFKDLDKKSIREIYSYHFDNNKLYDAMDGEYADEDSVVKFVMKFLKSNVPYSKVSKDKVKNDLLVPIMMYYGEKLGKNIIQFLGGDYDEYGGQDEFVVSDVSRYKKLSDVWQWVNA